MVTTSTVYNTKKPKKQAYKKVRKGSYKRKNQNYSSYDSSADAGCGVLALGILAVMFLIAIF
jgi:hypothetical protein